FSYDPAISRDGRFVAFVSGSLRLLPANFWHGTQIYLYDRDTTRLRRLSVDATGSEGDRCSTNPALSGDGSVLWYRTTSTNPVPADRTGDGCAEGSQHWGGDVFRHDWTCSDDGGCRQIAECPPQPMACASAENAVLRVRKRRPGQMGGDRL